VSNSQSQSPLEVAIGVALDCHGRVLVACRPDGKTSAGQWEFPGGKIEAGESAREALGRELDEEAGIRVQRARPLIRFAHGLGAVPVRLNVFVVEDWAGRVHGREGQLVRFVQPATMRDPKALPATEVILNALALPTDYLLTPPLAGSVDEADWLARLDKALATGIRWLRLRQPKLSDTAYQALAESVIARAARVGASVMLDRDAAMVDRLGAAGLHWPAKALKQELSRPVSLDSWFALSTHNAFELGQAVEAGADFATLSPVRATSTHPGVVGMGWPEWLWNRGDKALPVYALGGVMPKDRETARCHNAQGIAAIRGLWPN